MQHAAGDGAEDLRQHGLVAGQGVDDRAVQGDPGGQGDERGGDGGGDGPAGDQGVSFPGQPPDTIRAEFDHLPSDAEGLRMSTTGQPH